MNLVSFSSHLRSWVMDFFIFKMLPNALSFSDFLDFFAFPSHFIWLQNGTMKNVRFRLELNWSDTDGLVWPRHMLLDSIKRILVNRYHQDECILYTLYSREHNCITYSKWGEKVTLSISHIFSPQSALSSTRAYVFSLSFSSFT